MSSFPAKTTAILEKVASGKLSKAKASRLLGVSRKTIYEWIKEYQAQQNILVPESTSVKRSSRDRKQLDREVLRIALTSPGIGPKKISQELKIRGQSWSVRSVWLSLKRQNLSTATLRRSHAEQYRAPKHIKEGEVPKHLRLIPFARKRMVEDVLLGDEKVSDVTRKYHLSRKTFAKWKNRYLAAQANNETVLDALGDGHPVGSAHPRGASSAVEQAVLAAVIAKPHISSHTIAQQLGTISNHGVQRILERQHLNHVHERVAYSQEHAGEVSVQPTPAQSFWDHVRLVWEKFIVGLAPAPPPTFAKASAGKPALKSKGFVRTVLFSAVASSFISFVLLFWFKLLGHYSQAPSIGLFFASTALLMGTIFFLYSLKYYMTLAIVLSFSQKRVSEEGLREERWKGKGLFEWVLGVVAAKVSRKAKSGVAGPVGLEPNLSHVHLTRHPMVSIHIPLYNEKNVAERAVAAACNLDYPSYEVIIADDSTDTTPDIIRHYQEKFGAVHKTNGEGWTLSWVQVRPGVVLKHLHRTTREGFKGGALKLALAHTYPMVEFISVFDADFVPYPDTLTLFLKYFKVQNDLSEDYTKSNVAVVQGYQWHVLNKSENWITRGVRSEYAGSYVIERAGTELYGGLKMISGSVYMIRRAPLEEVGWRTSITEDFELTLRLYEKGYKVVYTPYIQAPAECVSTLKRLIRQRMRWAEGHSFNVKHMFPKLISSDKLSFAEKFEMMYLSPYYLQAFFFMVGTLSWLLAETAFHAHLPFWTSLWGWSLVLTNMLSLPLVNLVGLFLEESEQKDYVGIASFVALSYLVTPFQAYAAVKGFLEKEEGPWFRTPKTGRITDVFTRGRFYRLISGMFGSGRTTAPSFDLSFGSSMSPYLAFTTANNQFNSFSIRPKKLRWIGKVATVFVLIFSLLFGNLVPFASFGKTPTGNKITLRGKGKEMRLIQALTLTPEKKQYSLSEEPTFTLRMDEDKMRMVGKSLGLGPATVYAASENQIQTTLFYGNEEVSVPITVDKKASGVFGVSVRPRGGMKPGKYMLQATVAGEGGVVYQGRQDFTWGVLAINTNKSIYLPHEAAKLSLAVLDETGEMVCDAKLKLKVKSEKLKVEDELSTENGTIWVNPECKQKGVIVRPDYETSYQVAGAGNYEIFLTAQTKNGTYSVKDHFEVREQVPFDIERVGPTRIYPPNSYPMVFNVKANEDFTGVVEETVPESFDVRSVGKKAGFRVENRAGGRKVIWEVNWKKGGTYALSYEFDVPDVSPQFYLLGPVRLVAGAPRSGQASKHIVFEEARRWQIAADAISFRAAGAIATVASAGTSITLAAPAGTVATDVVLAVIYGDYGTGAFTVVPTGWTLVLRTDSTTVQNMAVYQALGNAAFTAWTIPANSNGTVGFTLGYIGVDNTTPMDVGAAATITAAASTTATCPTVTTVTANAWGVCFFGSMFNGTQTYADVSPLVHRTNGTTANGQNLEVSADGADFPGPASPGATGTHTTTILSAISIGTTVALRPFVIPENPFILFGLLPVLMWFMGTFRKRAYRNV